MVKTPKAPDLVVTKSLPRFFVEQLIKVIIITWLHAQAVGIIFYLLWHNSSHAFREFMFRDYIDFWQRWRFDIQTEFTPTWLQWIWSIPTWQDVWPWVVIGLLVALYIWGNRSLPSLKFKVPRTYRMKADNPYSPKHGKAGSTASDDEFGFDPSAFKNGDKPNTEPDIKMIEHLPYTERERRLKALADDPRTPKHERTAAKRKLKEMGR